MKIKRINALLFSLTIALLSVVSVFLLTFENEKVYAATIEPEVPILVPEDDSYNISYSDYESSKHPFIVDFGISDGDPNGFDYFATDPTYTLNSIHFTTLCDTTDRYFYISFKSRVSTKLCIDVVAPNISDLAINVEDRSVLKPVSIVDNSYYNLKDNTTYYIFIDLTTFGGVNVTLTLDSPIIDALMCKYNELCDTLIDNAHTGYDNGYADGYNVGCNTGYDNGYNDGFEKGCEEDFTGGNLFWSVINAPVTLIEGIFNFDLFGINIANFIKLVLSLLIVGFVIKKVI